MQFVKSAWILYVEFAMNPDLTFNNHTFIAFAYQTAQMLLV